MKGSIFAAAALAAASVTAQSLSNSSVSVYYVTEYYASSCDSTITAFTTKTYCSECEHPPTGTPEPKHVVTTYVTAYTEICSTAPGYLQEKTYTVTEPCPTPGMPRAADYIPQGFTVTTVSCTYCSNGLIATITTPVAASATAAAIGSGGQASGPASSGAPASISGGSGAPPSSPVGSGASPSGQIGSGASPSVPVGSGAQSSGSAGSAPPAAPASGAATTPSASGAGRPAGAAANPSSGTGSSSNSTSTPGLTPFISAASRLPLLTSLAMGAVGAVFALVL